MWYQCLLGRCRALMQDMSDFSSRQFDAAAANTAKRLPVVSAVPGTTLGLITLRAFATGGRLIGACAFIHPHL